MLLRLEGEYTVGSPIVVVDIGDEKLLKMADTSSQIAADEIDRMPKC